MIKSHSLNQKIKLSLNHSFLIFGAILMTFPFFWMILTSLKSSQEILNVEQWFPHSKYFYQLEKGEEPDQVVISGDTRIRLSSGDEIWALSSALKSENGEQRYMNSKGELVPFEKLDTAEGKVQIRVLNTGKKLIVDPSSLTEKTFMWSNYIKAWFKVKPSFSRYFFVSIFVAVVTTAGQVFTSILAAFAFVFFRFPFKNAIFTLFLATMMVPQQVLLIPNYLILSKLGWIDSFAALIVPWLAQVFGIFMLRQFFMQIPRDLFDAATIDGCTRFGFLFRILVPLALPPIITISIFTFLGSWNGLLWPLIVTNSQEMRTIQVGLSYFSQAEGTEWELLMAASTFCILPLVLFYFFAQKYFVQGEASSGLKG